jgi:hypothetical protein
VIQSRVLGIGHEELQRAILECLAHEDLAIGRDVQHLDGRVAVDRRVEAWQQLGDLPAIAATIRSNVSCSTTIGADRRDRSTVVEVAVAMVTPMSSRAVCRGFRAVL